MDDGTLNQFAALVVSDAALAARLAAIEDETAFVEAASAAATDRGIALSAAGLQAAARPDPLGLERWSARARSGTPPPDWLPIAVTAEPGGIAVDWAWFGAEPLRAAFYEDEIRRAFRRPFNRAFRRRTALADLVAQAPAFDAPAPSGLIFHMSRCGSTLVAQMLGALAGSIVISEAAPIDAVVQLGSGLAPDDATRALRAIVAAYARNSRDRNGGEESRYFIKLDCWHTLALPLFRRAFPDVPWVFLYRDPVEVLVSQLRQRGMQMVPQFFPPALFGIADADVTLDEDYCARVLGAICRAVVDHGPADGGLVVNYRNLPDAVASAILPHFGTAASAEDVAAMRRTSRQDAKSPMQAFAGDASTKQRAATEAIRGAAARHLGALYARLEAYAGAAPTA